MTEAKEITQAIVTLKLVLSQWHKTLKSGDVLFQPKVKQKQYGYHNVNSTSIVSGVGSRSFTATWRISKTLAGDERVNVLLSLEFSGKANNPSAQSAPCRLAP